jgi:hypothetical protein
MHKPRESVAIVALCIGSTIVYGVLHDLVTAHHGKAKRDMVVIKAPGAPMNPTWWTPEEIERYRTDPETAAAYKTDCLAEFATAEESMFSAASIDACTREAPLVRPREEGHTYFAAMDPATRDSFFQQLGDAYGPAQINQFGQYYDQLLGAQSGAQMAARVRHRANGFGAQFIGDLLQLRFGHLPKLR